MANYTVASGDWAVHNVTFSGGAENVITFADAQYRFEIVAHSAAAPIFYKYLDVATPVTVNDPDAGVLFAGANSVRVAENSGIKQIRMVTSGAATVSVMRA